MKKPVDVTQRPIRLELRLALIMLLSLSLCEVSFRVLRDVEGIARVPFSRLYFYTMAPVLRIWEHFRNFAIDHLILAAICVVATYFVILLILRALLISWNRLKARVTGTYFSPEDLSFPMRKFDILKEIKRRPRGKHFVGLQPRRSLFGRWAWKPVYLTRQQKSMHRHVLGKTGSGKTQSVLWPSILQDMLDGKGVVVIDAKGSDENIITMKNLAVIAGRLAQLRIFALPAWNRPELFTHSYNMLYVRPRSGDDRGGDPVAVAERVFGVLPLGENEYYNTQARIMFTNLCKVLHATLERGKGKPFAVKDVATLLKCIGATGRNYENTFEATLSASSDTETVAEIRCQVARLGKDASKCFTGLIGALDNFLSPMVNAYDPDIVFEEVLEKNLLVYIQLPANLYPIQAPAMGRVFLADVQQEGSLRQVFRHERNQTPLSVVVDEFYNFADMGVIDSLNKLRDANVEYTLAHQSIADLELVSREFAAAVWDNTGTKDILNQDNPELCEKVSKSLGTHQVIEKTVRQEEGALLTSLTTGDASTKLVEAYRLHPNAIKNLQRCGQGYLSNDEGLRPIVYATLPPFRWNGPLKRKDQRTAVGHNIRLEESPAHDVRALTRESSGLSVSQLAGEVIPSTQWGPKPKPPAASRPVAAQCRRRPRAA
jgi:type IV secretory pathway TraG/TraD family ATPase VirD4